MTHSMVPTPGIDQPQSQLHAYSNDTLSHVVEQALCRKCKAPLTLSAVRCQSCSTRHAMSDCSCCGGGLFKHASVQVIQLSWTPLPETGNLMRRLWGWLKEPRRQHTLYFHRECASRHPQILKDATVVFYPDEDVIQRDHSEDSGVEVSSRVHHSENTVTSEQPPNLVPVANHASDLSSGPEVPQDLAGTQDDGFQSWFIEHGSAIADLCNPYQEGRRDFSESKFQGLSLEDQCLKNIVLRRADLSSTVWNSVDLAAADLSDVVADLASFVSTKLVGAQFREASLHDAKIILSDLTQSDFYRADLRGSDFYSSRWQHSTLTMANLAEARLDAVDLSLSCLCLASFTRASMMEVTLHQANCEQANFSHANMSWANLREALMTRADLSDAVLQCADLCGADFSGAVLLGTDFLSTNIERVKTFRGAVYNDLTRFPLGFDPVEHEMLKVSSEEVQGLHLRRLA